MQSKWVLRLTIALTCLVGVYSAGEFYLGLESSPHFAKVWGYALGLLLAFWVESDARDRPRVYRPSLDYGLFVYMAWPVYVPYYVVRTRGRAGWLWILGGLGLLNLGVLLQLAILAWA